VFFSFDILNLLSTDEVSVRVIGTKNALANTRALQTKVERMGEVERAARPLVQSTGNSISKKSYSQASHDAKENSPVKLGLSESRDKESGGIRVSSWALGNGKEGEP
jgi:hypothetical protein